MYIGKEMKKERNSKKAEVIGNSKTVLALRVLDVLERHLQGKLTHLGREKQKVASSEVQAVAFRVLIGTILSHRTKDERTEAASQALLSQYPTPEKLAAAPIEKIRELIKPVGFYNSKAQYVKKCAGELVERFGANVPQTMEELTGLTGVGRKTAGCVIAYAFNLPAIPVDSHCHTVSNRLGLVKTSTPEKTEQALMEIVPKERWAQVNELFVLHGQATCAPVSPFCSKCPLNEMCPRVGVKTSR